MAALRATQILKQLDAHAVGQQMQALATLDTNHRDEVRRALSAVGPRAVIDLNVLLDSVHREVAEREAHKPAAPCWPYVLTLMDGHQLAEFRQSVANGDDPDTAARAALASGPVRGLDGLGTLRADEDVDDTAPKRRRSIPRYRPREDAQSVSGAGATPGGGCRDTASRTRSQPSAQREPFALTGIAAFDEHGRLGGDPTFIPAKPPWLIDSGETDDDEEDA
ncbi:MAG: hypothetical protein GEU76_01140 [Alphaproteobacteria bacterium]|nr:hypothetical protein [Alphaproteobacteria bacterium]